MSDFFKDFNVRRGFGLPGGSRNFLTSKRTVCVHWKEGGVREYTDITDPWKYIAKMKKRMDVKNAWIKDE